MTIQTIETNQYQDDYPTMEVIGLLGRTTLSGKFSGKRVISPLRTTELLLPMDKPVAPRVEPSMAEWVMSPEQD